MMEEKAYGPAEQPPPVRGLYAAVLAGGVLLYGLTAQRGISWQDSGDFQWRVVSGHYVDFTGLARVHPLYLGIGQALAALPLSDPCTKLNLFSGLAMAVALANLAAVVTLLTGRRWIGLAAAAMLAVCHTAWWLATIAEVYTLVVAGLTAELWLLIRLRRRPRVGTLLALAGVSGLGWTVHNMALLPLPVYVVAAVLPIVRRRLPAWSLPAAAGVWLAGASLYVGFIVAAAMETGAAAALRSALVGGLGRTVAHFGVSPYLKVNAALASMNFVGFLLPLAVVGWVRFRRTLGGPLAAALGAITLGEAAFAMRYPVPDQFTFLLPTLTMIALAAGVGLKAVADRSLGWKRLAVGAVVVSVVLPPVVYALAPAGLAAARVTVTRARDLPFRNEARYWLTPWKHNERSAERFVAAAFEQVAPDAVILADETTEHPLVLAQELRGYGPGVRVPLLSSTRPRHLTDFGGSVEGLRAAFAGRPVYVVSPVPGYCADEIIQAADFERPPGRVLYRVIWHSPATAGLAGR